MWPKVFVSPECDGVWCGVGNRGGRSVRVRGNAHVYAHAHGPRPRPCAYLRSAQRSHHLIRFGNQMICHALDRWRHEFSHLFDPSRPGRYASVDAHVRACGPGQGFWL